MDNRLGLYLEYNFKVNDIILSRNPIVHEKYNLLRPGLGSPLLQMAEAFLFQVVLAPGERGEDQKGNVSKIVKSWIKLLSSNYYFMLLRSSGN